MVQVALIDDDTMSLKVYRAALRRQTDWVLETIAATKDRIAAWRAGACPEFAVEPDLILLDSNLDGLSALELLPRLRHRLTDTAAIVILTGTTRADDREAYLSAGADGYWTKATCLAEIAALLASISGLLDRRRCAFPPSST